MKGKFIGWIGVLVLVIACAVGCATGGKGPSDAESVKALLASWKAAMLEKNADKIMATYAEGFSHEGNDYQAADKAGLRKFVDECKLAGYFDGLEISFAATETVIQGDAATISKIQCDNTQGTVTVALVAKKGKTGWSFTNMSIEGL